MNSHQNDTVLVTFTLVLQLLNCLNYTLYWFQTFNFMQLHPWKNFNFSPRFVRLFLFGHWFWIYEI
jgi:hypothetical protein